MISVPETKMTFHQFADYLNVVTGERPPYWRLGQWAFNVLFESYPEIANAVRGGPLDPFHNDDRLVEMVAALATHCVEPLKDCS